VAWCGLRWLVGGDPGLGKHPAAAEAQVLMAQSCSLLYDERESRQQVKLQLRRRWGSPAAGSRSTPALADD